MRLLSAERSGCEEREHIDQMARVTDKGRSIVDTVIMALHEMEMHQD